MQEKYNQLKQILNNAEEDLSKFIEKGNKTAGTRLRKALQEVREVAAQLRKEILESKKSNA